MLTTAIFGLLPVPLAQLDLGMLLMKLLAVAGGAVLGGAIAGTGARWLTRFTIRKQAPRTFVLSSRIVGCALAGIGVWLWAFGAGGSGFGFGTGGLGSGGENYVGYQPVKEEDKAPSDTQPEQKPVDKPGANGLSVARVQMLGGTRVQQDRFYVVDEQPQPVTLPELRELLATRKKQEKDPLKVVEIVVYEDSVDKEHPAVLDLEKWANGNGLQVTISFPQGKRP
jgi:hypothetical protein